ncbi:MAG: sugar phosphate isomerase/epimerase family protein [Candidatus Omnitrophota bacterium]
MIKTKTILLSVLFFGIGGIMMTNCVLAQEQKAPQWEVMICNYLLNQVSDENTFQAAKDAGVKAIEIQVNPDLSCPSAIVDGKKPYRFDTPAHAKQVKEDAAKYGLKVPVLCAPLSITAEKKPAPKWALDLIKNAPEAGVRFIYFPVGAKDVPDDQFVANSIALFKELTAQGKKSGVTIAFENLQYYWNRMEITGKVLAAFKPDELGLCLDPINLYWYGYPRSKVYELVKELIPRARHFHAKNVAHPEDKRETQREPGWQYGENSVPVAGGDLNFGQILDWLHQSGYQGDVSIEDDSLGHYPKEQRIAVLRGDVEYLRSVISALK